METDILKHFIGKDVEVLVSGVWIEGHMQPIAKGVVTLTPVAETAAFYGPTALKTDVIQAIRQVKRSGQPVSQPVPEINPPASVRSSLDQVTPGQRFKRNQ
jgi:hypothetical protein